jgi:hypothetical protein
LCSVLSFNLYVVVVVVSDHGKTKKTTRTRQTVPKASRSRHKTPNSGPKAKARESSPKHRQTPPALRPKKSQHAADVTTSILEKTIPVVPVDAKSITISKKKNKKNKGPTFLTACIDKLVQHSLAKILSLSKP